jgi:CheY-like chemotaxis protein
MAAITLLKSRPTWTGISWPSADNIRRVDSVDQITRAMSSVTTAAASVDRIIIEEAIAGTDFLSLLTSLPTEFLGDVLFIIGPGRAYLSRAVDFGGRHLYFLEGNDVATFAQTNTLPNLERLRVLVAEDEKKTREFLMLLLEKIGCEASVAHTGIEAVKNVQEKRPHILLLDGLLPEMHGFEVARFVRGLDASYKPRIVLVTAVYKHSRYQSEAKLKYGVDQYLVKPVTREQIANVIFAPPSM